MSRYELAYLKLMFQNLYLNKIGRNPIELSAENIFLCASVGTTKELYKAMDRMRRMSLNA